MLSITLTKIDQFVTMHTYEAYSPKGLEEGYSRNAQTLNRWHHVGGGKGLPLEGRKGGVATMQHLESGVVWGIVLLVAGLLLLLDALGLEIVSNAFWGILLLVAGALVLLRAMGGGRR